MNYPDIAKMCNVYGHALDQNDNVYNDMLLNKIFKLKELDTVAVILRPIFFPISMKPFIKKKSLCIYIRRIIVLIYI